MMLFYPGVFTRLFVTFILTGSKENSLWNTKPLPGSSRGQSRSHGDQCWCNLKGLDPRSEHTTYEHVLIESKTMKSWILHRYVQTGGWRDRQTHRRPKTISLHWIIWRPNTKQCNTVLLCFCFVLFVGTFGLRSKFVYPQVDETWPQNYASELAHFGYHYLQNMWQWHEVRTCLGYVNITVTEKISNSNSNVLKT